MLDGAVHARGWNWVKRRQVHIRGVSLPAFVLSAGGNDTSYAVAWHENAVKGFRNGLARVLVHNPLNPLPESVVSSLPVPEAREVVSRPRNCYK